MEGRVEALENEMTEVRQKMSEVDKRLEELNRDIGTKMNENKVRMEGLEGSVEVMKAYLRDLKEAMIGRDGGDKGKASVGAGPSLSQTPTQQNTVPIDREPSPFHNPSIGERPAPPSARMEEVGNDEEATEDDRNNNNYRGGTRRDIQFRRLDLPLFDGEKTLEWLEKIERYFDVNGIAERERLAAVGVCMEGAAFHWFRWRRRRQPFIDWRDFRSATLKRFRPDDERSAQEELFSIRLIDSVKEYRCRFELLSAEIEELSDNTLIVIFLNGLTEELREEVRLFRPTTLEETMERAQEIERKNAVIEEKASNRPGKLYSKTHHPLTRYTFPSNPNPTSTISYPVHHPNSRPNASNNPNLSYTSTTQPTRPVANPPMNSSLSTNHPTLSLRPFSQNKTESIFPYTNATSKAKAPIQSMASTSNQRREYNSRRLSDAEYRSKIEKGLCFRCDEKYTPGHRCRFRQLRVMVSCEDESEKDDEEGTEEEATEERELEASLNSSSTVGIDSPKTMKFAGTVRGKQVLVLLDSGATHNFISDRMVSELQIPIKPAKFTVLLGDNRKVSGIGRCKDVELMVQGVRIVQDFLPFKLGGVDMILGIDWLSRLGEVKSNWGKQTMRFEWEGQKVELKGDVSLSKLESSVSTLLKIISNGGHGFCLKSGEEADTCEAEINEILPTLVPLLNEFEDLFRDPHGLPPERERDHAIRLIEGAQPPNLRPYRYPHFQKNEIERMVKEMLMAGIIRSSVSPYSSPVLLVRKKDGGWRFCVDYRALNRITIPDKFPIPTIDELLDELAGAVIFSKLDLRSGYHQIKVKESDVEKTAFRTHDGHYEFLVMPFGLSNAPATFQGLMNDIFRPYLRKFVLVFFDDILVYSKGLNDHCQHLREVFAVLRNHQLVVNRKKCQFGRDKMSYLGHVVSREGVEADPKKISDMQNWPAPRDLRDLRGFLGLTGYYRRFVRGYGKIAEPLTNLLKKNSFRWSDEAQVAFEALKKAMVTVPVLTMPDFTKEFIVETDASGSGLGAVLMQSERPVAFLSKALSPRNKGKSVYERELMAIVMAFQKWRHYLLGRHFQVRTDQRSLKFLTEQKIVGHEQQKWLVKMLGFDFDIVYRPGCENKAADALSRKPGSDGEFKVISIQIPVGVNVIQEEALKDDKLRQIIQDLLIGSNSHGGYCLKNGSLMYQGRMVVSRGSRLVPIFLAEFHSSPMGGHSGFLRTYKRISTVLYWEGMKSDIKQFVAECEVCQRTKYEALSPAGLLQPLPIPSRIWEDVSMDFITGLPKVKGFDTILVVVDRLTKYGHFMAVRHPYTARDIASIFIREIVRLHGFPRTIVSDRDRVFMSNFWSEMFKASGTTLKFSSAYHPHTDGQTEVVNRGLETYLRCFCFEQQRTWPNWLQWAEYWFNTTFNASTGMTPFKGVYGRDPPPLLRLVDEPSKIDDVDAMIKQRNEILDRLKRNLHAAQERMKKIADKSRRELEFSVGDQVFLKLQPYRFRSLATKPNEKLSPRFYGPFQIEERIGSVAYKLKLPETAKIHPVFHVSQLKRRVGPSVLSQPLPYCLNEEGELEVQPEEVLNFRYSQQGDLELLIKWHNLPDHENSWELYKNLIQTFPHLYLEDKVPLDGRGNVRARVYVKKMRRNKNINLNTQAVKMLNNSSNGSTGGKGVDSTSGSISEMLQIAEHDKKPAGDSNSEITQSATNQQEKRDMQKKEGATVILADELANQDWKSNSEEKEKIKSLESMWGGETIFSEKGED
ncbi:uncharacterized protein LOC123221524 [Mangifera indica]|nr:uncharacterized protein LOC123221524 [Mangifera indica]